MLGYPSGNTCGRIAQLFAELRSALKEKNEAEASHVRDCLERERILTFLGVYLDRIDVPIGVDAGYNYILSTRQEPTLLKIGVTRRSVEERVREINSATGVAVPFGVRKVWQIAHAAKMERAVHALLDDYRIRPDREFFRMSFSDAVSLVSRLLKEAGGLARYRGIIASVVRERRFGFIIDEVGQDLFFHASEFQRFSNARPGMQVLFSRRDTNKSPVAYNIGIASDDQN